MELCSLRPSILNNVGAYVMNTSAAGGDGPTVNKVAVEVLYKNAGEFPE